MKKLKCKRCLKLRSIERFKQRILKDGFISHCGTCRDCINTRNKELLKDPARHQKQLESQHKSYQRHKKEVSAQHHKYYIKHAEEVCGRTNENYHKDKRRYKTIRHEWYENNKDSVLKRTKKYHRKHPEVGRKSSYNWRIKHPEKCREIARVQRKKFPLKYRAYNRKHRLQRRLLRLKVRENFTAEHELIVLEVFKYRCFNCGTNNKKLTLDHFYPLSKLYPLSLSNAIILCTSCNPSKWDKDPEDFFNEIKFKLAIKLMKKSQKLAKLRGIKDA
jgi:hypothetical protein